MDHKHTMSGFCSRCAGTGVCKSAAKTVAICMKRTHSAQLELLLRLILVVASEHDQR